MTPAPPADEAVASVSVRMGLIHRRADWTKARFLMYLRDTHGLLAARAPNLREYWQNAIVDGHLPRIGLPRGPWDFDGFSQLRFDDPGQAAQAFRDSAMAAALIADEQHFLGGLHIVTTIQEAVVPPPQDVGRGALLKLIILLTRQSDRTEGDFRHAWIAQRERVRALPGALGYRQNLVVARERIKGTLCAYEDLPIDGIAELWFRHGRALDAALASSAGAAALAHASTFLAQVTAFQVEERRVV